MPELDVLDFQNPQTSAPPPRFDQFVADKSVATQGIKPSNTWGAKRTGHIHQGQDFGGAMNADVGTADDGEVVFAGPNGNMGNAVKVKHSDGTISVYGHLNKINVQQGAQVKAGSSIGLLGQTGNAKGPHVHFELYQNGLPVDPAGTKYRPQIGGQVSPPRFDEFAQQAAPEPESATPPRFDDFVKTQQPLANVAVGVKGVKPFKTSKTSVSGEQLAKDIDWHFGPATLDAFHLLSADQQQSIARKATQLRIADEAKRKRGEPIARSEDWQLQNRQKLGLDKAGPVRDELISQLTRSSLAAQQTPEAQAARFKQQGQEFAALPWWERGAITGATGMAEAGGGVARLAGKVGVPGATDLGQATAAMSQDIRGRQAEAAKINPPGLLEKAEEGLISYAPLALGGAPESVLAKIGTGAATFGGYTGAQTYGRGESAGQALKEGAKAAPLGAVLGVPKSIIPFGGSLVKGATATLAKAPVIYGIARAQGLGHQEALEQTALLTGFQVPELIGAGVASVREAKTPEVLTQTVPDELQGKLRGGEIAQTLAAREAAVKPPTTPADVEAGQLRHVDLQQRYSRGERVGDFKKETTAQAEARRAKVEQASQPASEPKALAQPASPLVSEGAGAFNQLPRNEGGLNEIQQSEWDKIVNNPADYGGAQGVKAILDKSRLSQEQKDALQARLFPTQGEAKVEPPFSRLRKSVAPREGKAQNVFNESPANETPPAFEPAVAVRPSRPPARPTVSGAETSVRVPGTNKAYNARYSVREAEDIVPSHSPGNFQPNPDYYYQNDRQYNKEPQYQTQVINRSKSAGPEPFDPRELTNTSPTADSGPPIITSDGNVLGGNSRSMIIKRVYDGNPEGADAYKKMLIDQASSFGLDPAEIAKMKKPVLVRELSDEKLLQNKAIQSAITDLNVPSTTPLTREEQAAAGASRMSPEAADFIARHIERQGDDATLAKVMDSRGPDIINRLIEDGVIPAGERNTLLKNGKVTPEAKGRIERLLTGRVYENQSQIEATPASVRGNVERIAPSLLTLEGSDWDIGPDMKRAIDAATESRSSGMPLDEMNRQVSMVRPKFTDRQITLAKALMLGPRKATSAFRSYAGDYEMAKSGGGLFGAPSQEESFDQHFGEQPQKLRREAGAIDVDLLTLGVRPFAKDVGGKAVQGVRGIVDIADAVKKILAPATRGLEAKQTALSVRASAGEMARQRAIAERSLEGARSYFASQNSASNYEFIDRMERGQRQPDPKTQKFANTIRSLLDERRDQIRALGTGKLQTFITDYFPHIWKDPVRARNAFADAFSKRPFEGSKAFLKKRTLPLTSDGLDLGLEPVSNNPVDLSVLKLREMDKYLMAHRVISEMKANGTFQFFKSSERLPEGYKQIDDRVATVFSRGLKGELVLRGRYAAPEPAARIINNYLSPGIEATALRTPYKAWRASANALNQFQLGFSAFHAGFTTLDTMISRTAAGLEDIFRYGKPIHGIKTIASTPVSPITNLIQGSKMLKEYFAPGSQGGEIAKYVDSMVQGGGRADQNREYTNRAVRGFTDALKQGNIIGAALRVPGAAIETMAKPTMQWLVPRQKMGVFAEMAKREMERLGPNASQEEVRGAMAKAWDSVDNRMGQMVYDNLFWNKTAKDLAMASVRSVGWNLGTAREVGGGVIDYATAPKRMIVNMRKGKSGVYEPVFTHRMAYATALPLVVGAMGAMTQYMLTGKGPDELKDYFFPKTGNTDENGNPERIALPSYMKDIYHLKQEPGKVLTSKLHPLIGMVGDMWRNQDYYGTEIRNANDPLVQQLTDEAKYVGTALTPFSVRGFEKERERGTPISKALLPFVGITPAPSYINKSEADKLIDEKIKARMPDTPRTKEQFARSQLTHELTSRARKGEDVDDEIQQAVEAGTLTVKQAKTIGSNKDLTSQAVKVKYGLTINDALQVWDRATLKERADMMEVISKKAGTSLSKMEDGPIKDALEAQLEKRGIDPTTKKTNPFGRLPSLKMPKTRALAPPP